jgi:uncharacterized repeat protein (TIGR03803 family)
MTKAERGFGRISANQCRRFITISLLGWVLSTAVLETLAQAQTATEVVLHNFGRKEGASPYGTPFRDPAGNLYGTTSTGGRNYAGSIYRLDAAGHYSELYSFTGESGGTEPMGSLIQDAAGNLYGTTTFGGAKGYYAGAIFRLDVNGNYTALYNFTGEADGGYPNAGLTQDAAGNLYGTTEGGGLFAACPNYDEIGCGVIFKLDTAGNYTVLYRFENSQGTNSYSNLSLDGAGNLYGTTEYNGFGGCGSVFKLDPAGNFTTLHTFEITGPGPSDGCHPYSGVTRDQEGNLYGTTKYGGKSYGVVYKIDTAGNETVLYRFPAGAAGGAPQAGVIRDPAGNLFGTTTLFGSAGDGVVFKLDTSGHETIVHTFSGPDGSQPWAGLILDPAGNLYGATLFGGSSNGGTLFKVDPAGQETVLRSFPNGLFGAYPSSGLIGDASREVYGTTYSGGPTGAGAVYELSATREYAVLYSFTGGPDGEYPLGGVIRDPSGNFYGTTFEGGTTGRCPAISDTFGCGVVYKLDAAGNETVLYTFTGGADGANPGAGVILDEAENLYGTTEVGGIGFGVVYKLDPLGQETVLHSFAGGADGASPYSGVVRDLAGNVYGTTLMGGTARGCSKNCVNVLR